MAALTAFIVNFTSADDRMVSNEAAGNPKTPWKESGIIGNGSRKELNAKKGRSVEYNRYSLFYVPAFTFGALL